MKIQEALGRALINYCDYIFVIMRSTHKLPFLLKFDSAKINSVTFEKFADYFLDADLNSETCFTKLPECLEVLTDGINQNLDEKLIELTDDAKQSQLRTMLDMTINKKGGATQHYLSSDVLMQKVNKTVLAQYPKISYGNPVEVKKYHMKEILTSLKTLIHEEQGQRMHKSQSIAILLVMAMDIYTNKPVKSVGEYTNILFLELKEQEKQNAYIGDLLKFFVKQGLPLCLKNQNTARAGMGYQFDTFIQEKIKQHQDKTKKYLLDQSDKSRLILASEFYNLAALEFHYLKNIKNAQHYLNLANSCFKINLNNLTAKQKELYDRLKPQLSIIKQEIRKYMVSDILATIWSARKEDDSSAKKDNIITLISEYEAPSIETNTIALK